MGSKGGDFWRIKVNQEQGSFQSALGLLEWVMDKYHSDSDVYTENEVIFDPASVARFDHRPYLRDLARKL